MAFIQRAEGETEAKELRRELSNTYVALSEIYMTDLCDNEEAETESRRYIQVRTVSIYFIVLRIHAILVRIRIRAFMPVIPDPNPSFFVIDLQDGKFLCLFFLKLHHISKIKKSKRSHKTVGIKVLLTI